MSRVPKEEDEDLQRVGEYDVTGVLGAGMSGVVLAGIEPNIGKRVALKLLRREVSNDPEMVARFLREARAVNEVRHRGIVDIFAVGRLPDGRHYLVMELLEGRSLETIRQEGRVPFEVVLGWSAQVLEALSSAHAASIIHRDIKPSNLFLVEQGRSVEYIKLLDFGIAKLLGQSGRDAPQTQADMILGTPHYMAPEQIRGDPVSPATDLYTLGCVMFELICGRLPLVGRNVVESMSMRLELPAPSLSREMPDVPEGLDHLLRWMMERQPANRPATADIAREVVEELIARHPVRRVSRTPPRASPAVRTVVAADPRSLTEIRPPREGRRQAGPPLMSLTELKSGRGSALPTIPGFEPTVIRPASGARSTASEGLCDAFGLEPTECAAPTREVQLSRPGLRATAPTLELELELEPLTPETQIGFPPASQPRPPPPLAAVRSAPVASAPPDPRPRPRPLAVRSASAETTLPAPRPRHISLPAPLAVFFALAAAAVALGTLVHGYPGLVGLLMSR